MECRSCERSDSSRRFYCSDCVSTRLKEHFTARSKLRALISVASAKALDLLTPPPSADGTRWGVQEERELKAERYSTGIRLRDTRVGVEKGREELAAAKEAIEERRAILQRRRQNLTAARQHLTTLSAPPNTTSPPPPSSASSDQSLSSLNLQSQTLLRSLNDLHLRMEETRLILVRELLVVYALYPTPEVVPNPFSKSDLKNHHRSGSNPKGKEKENSPSFESNLKDKDSSTKKKGKRTNSTSSASSINSSSSTSTSSSINATSSAPYHLGSLPLPLLPLNPNHPALTTLLHLTRLIALYYSLSLPFTPLPNLFGPGRPGIKYSQAFVLATSAGTGAGTTTKAEENERDDMNIGESVVTVRSGSNNSSPFGTTTTTAGESYPLFLDTTDEYPTILSLVGGITPSSNSNNRGQEKEKEREKSVRKGMAALAYDLAWIIWKRGGEVKDVEECRDLGKLVSRAVGEKISNAVGGGTGLRPQRPTIPNLRSPTTPFPIEFREFLRAFAEDREEVDEERLRRRLEKGAKVGMGEDDDWDLI